MSNSKVYYGEFQHYPYLSQLTCDGPRRRKVWHQKKGQLQQAPSVSPSRPSSTTPLQQSYIHIKDIDPDDTSIQKYRFFARAVDFYPLKLEEAFYQFCKRCNVE